MPSSAQVQAIFDLIPGSGSVVLIDYSRKDAAILRTKPQWVDQVVAIYCKQGYITESAKAKHTDYYYIKVSWSRKSKR